jgi:3-phenylpropionate/cinnamic acid dioxygenase small subunit
LSRVDAPSHDDLYQRIRQFYVQQAQLLDGRDIAAWMATFREDAVFVQDSREGRVFAGGSSRERRGRAAIAAAARASIAARTASGVTRRHWVDLVDVHRLRDGTLRTRFNALLIETAPDMCPTLFLSAAGEDVLVPQGDVWLVRWRTIFHDDAT